MYGGVSKMHVGEKWHLYWTCQGKQVGPPIEASMWNVLTRLGAMKKVAHQIGWDAEAFPQIKE